MPRRSRFDPGVAMIADAQDGLITSAQLAHLGIARSTVSYRTHLGGMWNRVLPGVHLVTGGQPTEHQRERAALLYCGTDSMLTGSSALRLHGVRRPDSGSMQLRPVHVLVGIDRQRLAAEFVVVERTTRLPAPMYIDGLPVAPLARAVVDTAHRSTNRLDVLALVTEVIRAGRIEIPELKREMALGSRRGSASLREALGHAERGSWSGPEAEFRAGILTSGLPEPQWNMAIVTNQGELLAIVDGLYDDVWLALEVDSRAHHSGDAQWERTLRRSSRLTAYGVVVLHFTPTRIRRDLPAVLDEIRRAREALLGRQVPDLRASRAPRPGAWVSSPRLG